MILVISYWSSYILREIKQYTRLDENTVGNWKYQKQEKIGNEQETNQANHMIHWY